MLELFEHRLDLPVVIGKGTADLRRNPLVGDQVAQTLARQRQVIVTVSRVARSCRGSVR